MTAKDRREDADIMDTVKEMGIVGFKTTPIINGEMSEYGGKRNDHPLTLASRFQSVADPAERQHDLGR